LHVLQHAQVIIDVDRAHTALLMAVTSNVIHSTYCIPRSTDYMFIVSMCLSGIKAHCILLLQ
jgi:hypothetical protein